MTEPSPQPDAEPQVVFPAPPNVHWGTLLAAEFLIALLAIVLSPGPIGAWCRIWDSKHGPSTFACGFASSNLGAMSIFWCSAFVVLELVILVPSRSSARERGITIFGRHPGAALHRHLDCDHLFDSRRTPLPLQRARTHRPLPERGDDFLLLLSCISNITSTRSLSSKSAMETGLSTIRAVPR
jgi:hypothetical protein